MRKKICPVCGGMFEPKTWYQKFDCDHCRKRAWQLAHPKPKKPKEFKPVPQAQFLGRYCEVCGEPLYGRDGRSHNKKTCGAACRQALYAHRKAGGAVFQVAR